MNLKNIKTEKDLFDVGDNWYQRTHKLREVWQNENEEIFKQIKAVRLWYVMSQRVLKIHNEISKAREKHLPKFEKGTP